METRPFGKTGESFPILSFGGQRIVDGHGCTEEEAIEIVNTAIDRGIRYFDTAWVYSRGQAETRLGKVVKHRRSEMWIATKVFDTTRDGARRQLEESLTRLQTDHVNEWRMHDVHSFERLDAFTGKGGGLEAMIQAREEGLVRNISISGHKDPQVLVEALDRFPFDSALIAASALRKDVSAARAWRAVRRDAARHRSPNAGYPEAAMAGALDLSLAGPRVYGGIRVEDAFMGEGRRDANAKDIGRALALYRSADALVVVLVAVLAAIFIALG